MVPFFFPSQAVFDPLLTLLFALVLDLYLGELRVLYRLIPHPVVAIGRMIAVLDLRLNRHDRSFRVLRLRGVGVLLVLVLLNGGLAALLQWLAARSPLLWAVELLLVVSLLAQRSLYDHVKAVADGLQLGGLEEGRRAVSMIVGRDPDQLDGHAVCRASIESCSENFSDGIFAPVFWFVVAGLPGLVIYKTVNTLDSMIGHKKPQYLAFGWASARCDDLLNLIPARLAGGLLCLAALFQGRASAGQGWRVMWRDAGKHRSPNAGWPEAACAGALGLALCGPRLYRGEGMVDEPWLGAEGRDLATAEDIRRALRLMVSACLLTSALVLGLYILKRIFLV